MQTHDQTNNTTTSQVKLRVLPKLMSCRPISSLLGSCLLVGLFASSALLAADKQYTVQSGDTLGKIVRTQYPDVARQSYPAVMDTIVANNPKAFINGNKNSLKLGADLLLVDKEKIEGLKPKPKEVTPAERIQELENKLNAANQQIEQLKAGVTDTPDARQADEKETAQPVTEDAESNEQLQTLQASQEKLQAELNAAQEEITSLKKQLETAKTEASNEASKNEGEDNEVKALMAKLAAIEAEKEKLQADFTAKQEQAKAEAESASAEKITALEAEIKSLNTQLEEAKSTSKPDDVSKIEALTNEITELKTTNQQLQSDLTAQQETVKAGTDAEKTSADKIQSLTTQLEEAQASVERLTAQTKEQETQIAELKANAEKTQEGSLSAEEAEALQSQVDQLATLAEKYEQDIETLQAQLDAKPTEPATSEGGEGKTEDGEEVEALKAQVEQLTTLAEKYEADLEALQGEGNDANESAEKAQADAEALTALKAELEDKDTRISELERQVNDFTLANADLSKKLENAGGSSKWLLWLLPILGLLGGSYLLSSRLRKRADEEAAAELKSVMASAEAVVEKSLEEKEADDFEAGIKLDIAKAYLELSNTNAAHEMLQEVLREGSTSQQEKAEKLLESIQ